MAGHYFYQLVRESQITFETGVFKLILCMIAGGMIGLNRQWHKEAAGFRTHILICVGSGLLMILSIYVPQTYIDFKNGDPGRIAAQVVTGIGFLGAGAIIRLGNNVKGLTTAASIWLISAVGLTIGAGLYVISFITVIIAMFTLIVLERFEKKLFPKDIVKTLTVAWENHHVNSENLKKLLKNQHIQYTLFDINISTESHNINELKFTVRIPENSDIGVIINAIHQLKGIKEVSIG